MYFFIILPVALGYTSCLPLGGTFGAVTELEATIRELKGQNSKLDSDLAEATAQCSALSRALEAQKTHTSSIQSEFESYKKEHKIGSENGALQGAVAALQAKVEERQDE